MSFKKYTVVLLLFALILCCPNVACKKNKKSKSKNKKSKRKRHDVSDELFDIPSPEDVISEYGVVFSWHAAHGPHVDSDIRWTSETIGRGNEFKVAVMSVKNAVIDNIYSLHFNILTSDNIAS